MHRLPIELLQRCGLDAGSATDDAAHQRLLTLLSDTVHNGSALQRRAIAQALPDLLLLDREGTLPDPLVANASHGIDERPE